MPNYHIIYQLSISIKNIILSYEISASIRDILLRRNYFY